MWIGLLRSATAVGAAALGAMAFGACSEPNQHTGPRDCTTPDQLTMLGINPREIDVAVGRTVGFSVGEYGPSGPFIWCPPVLEVAISDKAIANFDASWFVKGVAPGTT